MFHKQKSKIPYPEKRSRLYHAFLWFMLESRILILKDIFPVKRWKNLDLLFMEDS